MRLILKKSFNCAAALACLFMAMHAAGESLSFPPAYVATIQPVAMILKAVAGDRATVTCLLPDGASPHTYSPRPSDVAQCAAASRVFMVAPQLDAWAARLTDGKAVMLLSLLPTSATLYFEHGEEEEFANRAAGGGPGEPHAVADPHFWTDPLTVKALLPALAAELIKNDPEGADAYREGAAKFAAELDRLDARIAKELEPARGSAIALFHPSWNYLMRRYGLKSAGVFELVPGKMLSPRELLDLTAQIKAAGGRAIITEPQLARRPADLLAETSGLKAYTLDPFGGGPGIETYPALLQYNARILAEALR